MALEPGQVRISKQNQLHRGNLEPEPRECCNLLPACPCHGTQVHRRGVWALDRGSALALPRSCGLPGPALPSCSQPQPHPSHPPCPLGSCPGWWVWARCAGMPKQQGWVQWRQPKGAAATVASGEWEFAIGLIQPVCQTLPTPALKAKKLARSPSSLKKPLEMQATFILGKSGLFLTCDKVVKF